MRLSELEEAGYIYFEEIRGPNKILQLSAKLMLKLMETDFKKIPDEFNKASVVFSKKTNLMSRFRSID